jgi:hypothetical protein
MKIDAYEGNGAEGLVLSGGSNRLSDGSVGEAGFNLSVGRVLGVALVVKWDVARNLLDVGLFGEIGVVLEVNQFTNLVKQLFRHGFHNGFIEKSD